MAVERSSLVVGEDLGRSMVGWVGRSSLGCRREVVGRDRRLGGFEAGRREVVRPIMVIRFIAGGGKGVGEYVRICLTFY